MDHGYVGLTAGLQQGQGARVMAVVYSLVQSCFTLLQNTDVKIKIFVCYISIQFRG